MKKLKKVLAIAATLIMMMALCIPAMAAEINISNAVEKQTYTAYKIFDVTTADLDNGEKGYAYTLDAGESVIYRIVSGVTGVTLTPSADGSVYNVSIENEAAAKELAKALNEQKDKLTATKSVKASDSTVIIDGLEPGYYFVDSSLGAVCALVTADSAFTVLEKNEIPKIEKEKVDPKPSVSVGDTVEYKITVTAGGDADTDYVVRDTMSEGLTLKEDSISIKVNGADVASGNYTIKETPDEGDTFTIVFPKSYTSTLAKDTEIVITYSATVNDKAVTGEVNNQAALEFGDSSSVKKVTTYTYRFDLKKVNKDGDVLEGAEFDLYDAKTGGNQIQLVAQKDENGMVLYYRPATAEEKSAAGFVSAKLKAGTATIKGLAAGTYYLEETTAPDGYNKLDQRVEVKIVENDGVSTLVEDEAVEILNQSGSILPSTGGIGTTIFYVIGGILVAGAAVAWIVRKRMSGYED